MYIILETCSNVAGKSMYSRVFRYAGGRAKTFETFAEADDYASTRVRPNNGVIRATVEHVPDKEVFCR
jgi:hypothetical protein